MHAFPIDESDRQVIILALARLALDRPGWNIYLTEVASRFHGEEMFASFKESNTPIERSRPIAGFRLAGFRLGGDQAEDTAGGPA